MFAVILAVSFPFLLFGAMAIDRWMNGPGWDLNSRRKSARLDGEMGDGDIQTLHLNGSSSTPDKRQ